ncbi:YiiX/YebB-like N1pC/P60 family cysteine hydrolase [Clostridiaceae bacterium M8S5]|nr:YiiX/YebB-like N1pC/P60 family cysteine hydrolase [Clostridiaceae bacterium M8S5]
MKRGISIVKLSLLISVVIVFTTMSFAINYGEDITKLPGYYEGLSEFTNIPIEQLKELVKEHGELTNYMGIDIDIDLLKQGGLSARSDSSGGGGSGKKMTEAQFNSLKSYADEGDMLVTKDSKTWFVNHGHAAIISDCPSNGDKYIVQAIGPDVRSKREKVDSWAKYYKVRIYHRNSASLSQRRSAGSYAKYNLVNKKYSAFPSVGSSSMNCATLIYKAYKSVGIKLKTSKFFFTTTMYPNDIVGDGRNGIEIKINWGGGNHSW